MLLRRVTRREKAVFGTAVVLAAVLLLFRNSTNSVGPTAKRDNFGQEQQQTTPTNLLQSSATRLPLLSPPSNEDQQLAPVGNNDGPVGYDKEGPHGDEEIRGPGMVQLNFMGRLGNNLFEYASARALADRLGWALSLDAAAGNKQKYSTLLRPDGRACFPGVKPLGPSVSDAAMSGLMQKPFQGLERELEDRSPRRILMQDWFQDYQLFSGDKDRIRQIMAIDRSCCGSTVPGPNDLVIHHRNYKAELTEELYERLHFKDLKYEFYDTVLRDISSGDAGRAPETIWVVGEFGEDDVLVKRLRAEHDNIRIAENLDDQFRAFCFLAQAPRLVMAHSTFSWWVAFLGNATEIHFPLSRPGTGVTVPKIVVTGDPRYVYRDDSGRVVSPPA